MPELKIAIETLSLRQPLKRALRTAAQLGADAVTIDARREVRVDDFSQTAPRQLRKLLDDLNLRVAAVNFPTRGGYDEPRDLERRIAATRTAMEFAYKIGARVVVNKIGQIPDDPHSDQASPLIDSLTNLATHGDRVGAVFAVRTVDGSAENLAQLIDALPEGAIGASLDPRALIIHGETPHEAVAQLGPHIRHVHVNDAVRDLAVGRAIEVTLGRGSADLPALLGALEEFNYRGWFSIERHDCDDPVGEIGDAVQYLRSL